MTVYVTQQPKPNSKGWMADLTSAAKYGPFEYVFDSHEKVFALPMPSIHKARRKLKDFNPAEDYVLHPQGCDPIAYAIVMAVVAETRPTNIKLLNYDRIAVSTHMDEPRKGVYMPINLELVKADLDVKGY